jgi:hypothetical protein
VVVVIGVCVFVSRSCVCLTVHVLGATSFCWLYQIFHQPACLYVKPRGWFANMGYHVSVDESGVLLQSICF